MKKALVLIAEDYEDVRLLYEECLRDADFDVVGVADGAEAITRAAESKPAAIVMDLQMPVVDGWEAIRVIRALELEPRPFILAVTAHLSEDGRARARNAGADEFLKKPLDPTAICKMLREALSVIR